MVGTCSDHVCKNVKLTKIMADGVFRKIGGVI